MRSTGAQSNRWLLGALLAGLIVGSDAGEARAADAIVLGDSIGKGLAATVGLKTVAKISFSLRKGDIEGQLAVVPPDAVGLISLGLNDAGDPVSQLDKFIERMIEAMLRSGRKLVWLGPPCVLKKWDARAAEMDEHLRRRLATTAIQYVSLRDDRICAPKLRTGDGEHFTVEGYRYLWDKIRRDSTLAASVEPDACEKSRADAAYQGRKPPVCPAITAQ